jgi:hypothetical protein
VILLLILAATSFFFAVRSRLRSSRRTAAVFPAAARS